mgnify:CR=1 FL=1
MATKRLTIKKDEPVPKEIAGIIETAFSDAELKKARDKGAQLRITLTTPWPKERKKKKPKVVIDDSILEKIEEAARTEEALERELAGLSGPQIQEIGMRLGISISKASRVESKRAQLQNSLRSGEIWRGISGQASANEERKDKDGGQKD